MDDLTVITEEELTKAGVNLLNTEQLNFLLQKTPKNHIFKRVAKGGGHWEYVTGVYVKKVLNLVFGWDWSFEIIKHEFDLNIKQAYVLGKLTVHSGGRDIIKMQFGRADIKFKKDTKEPLDIGNDLKAASTDALKKCASELGVASDIYGPNEFKALRIIENQSIDEMKQEIETLLAANKTISTEDKMYIEMTLENNNKKEYLKILKKLR